MTTTPPVPPPPDGLAEPVDARRRQAQPARTDEEQARTDAAEQEQPDEAQQAPADAGAGADGSGAGTADAGGADAGGAEEPEPFSDGPPPLPEPMLVLDGTLPPAPGPEAAAQPADHGRCTLCGGAYDEDGWCTECGSRKADPRHHFTAQPDDRVAAVCDRGLRHEDNEDAMAVWADGRGRAALVVCDGVTTATRSAEASLAAADAALAVLVDGSLEPDERIVAATDAAAEAVEQVGRDFPDSAPSCTYVAALVQDGTATVGSVGDSRAYWLPDAGEPLRLTTDDSMAEEQVQAGLDRQTAEAGPMAHTITRWLGPDAPDHTPVVTTQDVTAPGWLLLCSDGLWNYASEPRALREVVHSLARPAEVTTEKSTREQGPDGPTEEDRGRGDAAPEAGAPHTPSSPDPLALAQALVRWANERGGADNITVALVRTPTGQDGTHG
ncbi:PP2C family protein-serine/threonine phosphatase [Ornithinimicrobium sp. W1665]|uniref:PP2C family protein-serine/threonine phosphatase n=1 Tax=Ornithinimicrobium sp. W1665 TaxID=3416666 RepID=UPI003CEF4590